MKHDQSTDDFDESYLEEACYYLHVKKGLTFEELSKRLEISLDKTVKLYKSYEKKIRDGRVDAGEDEINSRLWIDVHDEATGNEKITFARDDGFYHCKRSDLEAMDGTALMSIFESSRRFLDYDVYKRYLDSKPPVGFDPMALQRQIRRATVIIEEILKDRYNQKEKATSSSNR